MGQPKHPSNILRRCAICKKFHASYLVPDDDGGQNYYCYDCWKARFQSQPELSPDEYSKHSRSVIPPEKLQEDEVY
jgi:hypothetical protein